MASPIFLQTFLFLHLLGLIMIAGITLIDFVIYRQFWKQYSLNREKGLTIMGIITKLGVFMAVGGITLIVSGVGMMIVTHGVFDQFIWFKIKMIILLLLILNIVLVGRRNMVKLRKTINGADIPLPEKMGYLKRNISNFQYSQVLFLLLIIFLSVFKFS